MHVGETATAMATPESAGRTVRAVAGLAAHPDGRSLAARGAAEKIRQIVATEVIPRLLLSARSAQAARAPSAAQVDALLRSSLAADAAAAPEFLCAARASGASAAAILDTLLTPVAQRLGDLWTNDAVDFVDVALAAVRLGVGIRKLEGASGVIVSPGAPAAMVMTLENERHSLGAQCVGSAFREAGWRVREAMGVTPTEAAAIVAAESFDFLGVSVADPARRAEATGAVQALRRASLNCQALIVVGGAACGEDPDFAAAIGADFSAGSCAEALSIAAASLRRG